MFEIDNYHLYFALTLVIIGGIILLNIQLKRKEFYPENYHRNFSLGRITDREG